MGGGGGGGVVAKRYDGFCGVILMAYLVANVHGCKKTLQAIHKSYYNITEKQTKSEE